jgi:glutamine amidotransferase
VLAENALGVQSNKHPDGWGVAYYVEGAPHVMKSPTTALSDSIFHRVSGVVASETVLAHVRQATQGENTVLNCHPFQHGRWTFAHNGDIPNFASKKALLVERISPRFRRYVLGDTDSEVLFYIFMSLLRERAPHGDADTANVVETLRTLEALVREICDEEGARSLLTIIVTDGGVMAAMQGGKQLFFSTFKRRCADREQCPHLSEVCENETRTGFVNHLIFSSEVLSGENVWVAMGEGDIVAVDRNLRLFEGRSGRAALPVLGAAC